MRDTIEYVNSILSEFLKGKAKIKFRSGVHPYVFNIEEIYGSGSREKNCITTMFMKDVFTLNKTHVSIVTYCH